MCVDFHGEVPMAAGGCPVEILRKPAVIMKMVVWSQWVEHHLLGARNCSKPDDDELRSHFADELPEVQRGPRAKCLTGNKREKEESDFNRLLFTGLREHPAPALKPLGCVTSLRDWRLVWSGHMLVHVHTKCPRAAECWNYLPRSQWGLETRSESGIVQSHISTLLSLSSPPPPTFQNNEVVSLLCDVRTSLLGCVHSDEAPLSWEIKWFGLFRGTGLGALALTWPVNRTSRSRRPRVQPQLGGGGGVGETFWTAGVLCEAGNKYTTFRSYFSRARTTLALNVPFLSKGSLVPFFFPADYVQRGINLQSASNFPLLCTCSRERSLLSNIELSLVSSEGTWGY